jgi:hypothetical protein
MSYFHNLDNKILNKYKNIKNKKSINIFYYLYTDGVSNFI